METIVEIYLGGETNTGLVCDFCNTPLKEKWYAVLWEDDVIWLERYICASCYDRTYKKGAIPLSQAKREILAAIVEHLTLPHKATVIPLEGNQIENFLKDPAGFLLNITKE